MLGLCPHDFLWPRRAADGDYYQVCRLCGAEHKYDWEHMRRKRRTERTNAKPKSASAPVLWRSGASTGRKAAPPLSLLLELEPAHRVFFRNLADILLFRPTPSIPTTSRPAAFWPDVFVNPVVPWRRLLESLLCHTIAVAALFLLSQPWAQPEQSPRRVFHKSYVSYYTPSNSFPALRGSQSPVRARTRKQLEPARQAARQAMIKVAPERAGRSITPPDIKLPGAERPNLMASNLVAPAMPLAATRQSQLTVPAGPTWVVAPPPDVNQATSRRSGLPQASVVAPAPEVGGVSSRGPIATPSAVVIAPPPVVQASIRRVGDIDIGPSAVVAPAPRLPTDEQSVISGRARANLGGSVPMAVPPPPSVQRTGTLADGRASGLPGRGLQVVPPPPSVHDAGNPSGGRRASSLSGAGLQAVPPAPPVQEAGNSIGGGRANSLSGTGLQAVPPAPSVQEAGGSIGGGRANSLSGAGLQGAQPGPPGQNGRNPDGGGSQVAMNIPPTAVSPVPPSVIEKRLEPASEEVSLRLIGMALALPNSSYFSNYEVFIAEKRLRKDQAQLIKLVYVSLPYQRRLSEYSVDNSKVYKLRVSRDKTCDESLLQMTWPETDPHPDSHNAADSPALSPADRNGMLPCYRTTADDYRRAISRGH